MLKESETPTPISVSVEDGAKLTGLGRTMLFNAIKDGDLVARKAGARTVILIDDLRNFVSSLPLRKAEKAA